MNENTDAGLGHTISMDERLSRIAADVASVKSDVDRILPPLVEALKRDRAFDEVQQQLRRAEKAVQAWRDAPLIIGIHDALIALRQTPDADKHLVAQLEDLLYRAGVEEYGMPGEIVAPEEVDVTASIGTGTTLTVSVCKRPGLRIEAQPLRKPIVEVTRTERTHS